MKVCAVILIVLVACAVAKEGNWFSNMRKLAAQTLQSLKVKLMPSRVPTRVPSSSVSRTHHFPDPSTIQLYHDWRLNFQTLLGLLRMNEYTEALRRDTVLLQLIRYRSKLIGQLEALDDRMKKIFAVNLLMVKQNGLNKVLIDSFKEIITELQRSIGTYWQFNYEKAASMKLKVHNIFHNGLELSFLAESSNRIITHFDGYGPACFNGMQVSTQVDEHCLKNQEQQRTDCTVIAEIITFS